MKTPSRADSKASDALRTIGEVAEQLDVPHYVLRFWESKFPQVTPEKHRGRRYYRPQDIMVLEQIKTLLYSEKYTIKGVQGVLNTISAPSRQKDASQPALLPGKEASHSEENTTVPPAMSEQHLQGILDNLRVSRNLLKHILDTY